MIVEVVEAAGAALLGKALAEAASHLGFRGTRQPDLLESIPSHVEAVRRWSSHTAEIGLARRRPLLDTFIDLDLNVRPLRWRGGAPPDRSFKVSDLRNVPGHVAIIGDPGAGKTTALKRIAHPEQGWATDGARVPLLIQFRTAVGRRGIVELVLDALGVSAQAGSSDENSRTAACASVAAFLDRLNAFLLLDGFDEAPLEGRALIQRDLEDLCRRLTRARVLLSSRTGSYSGNLHEGTVLELAPLDDHQVLAVASKWLQRGTPESFLADLRSQPYFGTHVRPLSLVQLCLYYNRKGRIPDSPRTVYRLLVRLFVEDWDDFRAIERDSLFEAFDQNDKEEFLEALAFELAIRGGRGFFEHHVLRAAYGDVIRRFPSLPPSAAHTVIREVSTHTGLVFESGDEGFEFYHLSLQEYLAGRHLQGVGFQDMRRWPFSVLASEYAVAVALSGDPVRFLANVVSNAIVHGEDPAARSPQGGIGTFVARLLVERPRWQDHVLLGAAVAVLWSYRHGSPEAAWDRLFSQEVVLRSLARFVEVTRRRRPSGEAMVLMVDSDKMRATSRELYDLFGTAGPMLHVELPLHVFEALPGVT
jgi:hypothetical protein